MTARANTLAPLLLKEVRALAPTFAAALAAVLIGGTSTDYGLVAIGLLGFAFGSVALGAQSIGHEFHYRTAGFLLGQPLARARTYLLKFAVLALMIASLTAITLPLYAEKLIRAASRDTQPSTLLMIATCGLFLAPCLTILCRSTLAAVVFTIAIPGLLATGGDIVGVLIYGAGNAWAVDHFKMDVFWRGMFLITGLAAIAGWWLFARLEVIEGHRDIALPGWLTLAPRQEIRSSTRTGHFVRALLTKELRLHQIPYVLAVLYAATMAMLPFLHRLPPATLLDAKGALTVLYAGFIALLIGSLSSAQERHLGTLEWQTLQPVPAWKQWALKVTVAWTVAIVLGVALPLLLGAAPRFRQIQPEWMVASVVLVTTAGLYLSTLCRNSMSAFVLSIPVLSTVAAMSSAVRNSIFSVLYRSYLQAGHRPRFVSTTGPWLLFGAGLVVALLWFGFVNHRTAERSALRTVKQALVIAAYIAAGLTAIVVMALR